MSHWNHRVIRRYYPDVDETQYGIHETFYDLMGDPLPTFSADADGVVGESVEELRQTLQWMLAALDKPVIDYDTWKELTATGITDQGNRE